VAEPLTEPFGPVAVPAVIDGYSLVRAVLADEPLPVIAGEPGPVFHALALLAAGAITGRLEAMGAPPGEARALALGFAEHQLSCLMLGDPMWTPDDPPLPLGESYEH